MTSGTLSNAMAQTTVTTAAATQQPVRRKRGHPKLATTMATVPDFTMFRKFSRLNLLNLLRLQAELQVLEDELNDIQDEDEASGDTERLDLTMDFLALRESKEGINRFQAEKLDEIAQVLREYNEALLQTSQLSTLPAPTQIQLREYQKWLTKRSSCGVNFPRDWEDAYTPTFNDDQVTFFNSARGLNNLDGHRTNKPDPITSFLDGPVTSLVHRFRQRRRNKNRAAVPPDDDGIAIYSDATVERVNNVLVASISSLLPTVCVIVLYFIPSVIARLGAMVAFTVGFSAALAFFTNGRKVEIFSATAAFAAVEVVFIGSTSTIHNRQDN